MKEQNKIAKTSKGQVMSLEQRRQNDLVLFHPSNCFKYSHKLKSVKDVLTLPSKTLGDFYRSYGREWVIGYISMWLIELNDDSNVKTKMSDGQIEFTAERIFDTYSLKVTDLTLFFRNVKEGKYGEYYENLSREKIMKWIAEYFEERCEYAAMVAGNQHEKLNVNTTKVHPDVISKMFNDVGAEKVEHNHEKNTLGKRTKGVITLDLLTEIKKKPTKELQDYLIQNDVNSESYNENIYQLIEKEIDLRNNG